MSRKIPSERVDAVIAELAQAAARADQGPEPSPQQAPPSGERELEMPAVPTPVLALVTCLIFVGLTVYNLRTFFTQSVPPSPSLEAAKQDLAALATVESSLLQSHYETYGAYPQDPTAAGVETDGLHYLRLSPHQFEMTLESDGVAVTLDSTELARQARAEADDFEDWQ